MSWRDDMRPASFRGVPFEVRRVDRPTGRRLSVEEFPERDDPGHQDLGVNRLGAIRIDGFVYGPDYMAARNALMDALETKGPGELVDPYYGRLWVSVGACEISESHDRGGVAEFRMEFFRRAEIERQVWREPVAAGAIAAASAAEATATDAATAADAALTGPRRAPTLAKILTDFTAIVTSLGRDIDEVIPPGSGTTVADLATALAETIQTFDDATRISGHVLAGLSASLPETVSSLLLAYERMIRLVGLRRATEIGTLAEYESADDAEAAQDRIVEAARAIEEVAGQPPEVLAELLTLRTVTVAVMTAQITTLPRLREIDIIEPTPAVVLAMDLYGDPDRAEEIVRRNAIANPGFVRGPITVLAS